MDHVITVLGATPPLAWISGGIALTAFTGWKIRRYYVSRSNRIKIMAKNKSVAAGRDVSINKK